MIVTLDGERLSESFPPSATLQALVDQLRPRLGQRLVVSLAVDGRELLDQELSDRLGRSVEGIRQVDLTSADRWQLAADVLREVAGRINDAGQQQSVVAELLRAGNVAEGLDQFGKSLEAWQTCHKAIAQCGGLLGQDLTALDCEGRTVREHLADLAEKLRELRGAFEARDTVLLVDLVQYELPDLCHIWCGVLNDLANQVATGTVNAGSNA